MIFDKGGMTPGERLFSARGSQSAILSEEARKLLNLDLDDMDGSVFLLDLHTKNGANRFF